MSKKRSGVIRKRWLPKSMIHGTVLWHQRQHPRNYQSIMIHRRHHPIIRNTKPIPTIVRHYHRSWIKTGCHWRLTRFHVAMLLNRHFTNIPKSYRKNVIDVFRPLSLWRMMKYRRSHYHLVMQVWEISAHCIRMMLWRWTSIGEIIEKWNSTVRWVLTPVLPVVPIPTRHGSLRIKRVCFVKVVRGLLETAERHQI